MMSLTCIKPPFVRTVSTANGRPTSSRTPNLLLERPILTLAFDWERLIGNDQTSCMHARQEVDKRYNLRSSDSRPA